jgi:peptidylprolyl isomerase
MNNYFIRFLVFSFLSLTMSCKAPGGNENTSVLIKTTMGDMKVRLYDETPIHRDNFIKLVKSGFYDGISFHRVINKFMIQAGDPLTRSVPIAKTADSLNTYTIPAEFRKQYFHKKGALAAAREGNDINPEMRSSGTQFYLVQGVPFTDEELDKAQQKINSNLKQSLFDKYLKEIGDSAKLAGINLTDGEIQEKASVKMFNYLTTHDDYIIPEDQRAVYKTSGGVPRLDQTYTVFGEITEGLNVLDKIAAVKTDVYDRPVIDVKILKMSIIK